MKGNPDESMSVMVCLLFFFQFFELALCSFDSKIYGFFESICHLGSHYVVVAGRYDIEHNLFIHGCFGFYDFEICLEYDQVGITASKTVGFTVYKVGEAVSDFKVDGLDSYFHNHSFLMHVDVRVDNSFLVLYMKVGVPLRGSKRGMTQEFLHSSKVGAIIEHIGCKGMAQGMGRTARRLHIGFIER